MKLKTTMTAAVLAMTFGMSANAANIALTDPSFETGAFGGSNGVTVSGWFTFGSSGFFDVDGGFWGDMANRDGVKAIYGAQDNENDGGSIYQSVELDAGITYVFTAGIGTSVGVNKNDGKYALVFFNETFATLHAETTGVVANQTGSFSDDSVQFTPTVSGKYQVGLRNRGYVPGTGGDINESTVFFDNARLDVVPEPSTTALLGLGGLALILRRRK